MRIRATGTALCAALLLAACGKDAKQPAAASTAPEVTASQVMYALHQRITKSGVLKVDLHGDTATTLPNDPKVQLKGVRLKFYDESGKLAGDVTSQTGEYDTATGAMIARGSVVMVLQGAQGPRVIHTEELFYDQKGDRVWSDKATRMEEQGHTYNGSSFTSNTNFTNLTVQNLVTSGITTGGPSGGLSF